MQIFVKTLTGKTITLEFYKVDDSGKVQRLRKECPNAECGAGTFMANHFDRHYCDEWRFQGHCYASC
ncbi:UBIQUITIN-40S RIBOSOMAL PROTEIN S27A-1 [Salix koriyanagi]|uniref:UBIQUITIN-40S RIBOSOMAL PROTEIN S27A-1 n=1 Tax=Salix koriyanagi TaxID=2511006 RepID=A0A9Q1AAQ0_9ROSI|nr:UBIQUITIN-40S RIBOSOMAL PROTEIN S27A-1 [Salix koriyanagi]